MEILAHRGFWKEPGEKNSSIAFRRSAENSFGVETDARDYNGQLVIAHDVPVAGQELMLFDDFLELYYRHAVEPGYLAINIKADGLQQLLLHSLQKKKAQKYFVFDMSIPDAIGYKNLGIPFYSRLSEYEQELSFAGECEGVWLDAFTGTWYTMAYVENLLNKGKKVCIVSPELHKREHGQFWNELKNAKLNSHANLLLCTDFPDEATTFFHEQ